MNIYFNEHLASRIKAIFDSLDAGYAAGLKMSAASKGSERELFVSNLLKQVFPNSFRFTSGDITDSWNNVSGQIDLVLENPAGYSFPFLTGGPRMFLAEYVAAVVEVKSDMRGQWNEVEETARKVKALSRKFSHDSLGELIASIEAGETSFNSDGMTLEQMKLGYEQQKAKFNELDRKIPVYAVGFQGYKKMETLEDKVENSDVDGIFCIKERLFAAKSNTGKELGSMMAFLQALDHDFRKETDHWPPRMSYRLYEHDS